MAEESSQSVAPEAASPSAALPSQTTPGGRPVGGHLGAVDVVRFLTVGGVVLVHSTSLTAPATSVAAGGVLQIFHVTRSVFLFLSAFVLCYSAVRRPLTRRAFWRRRYPLVVAPYVAWSAIYFLTDGNVGSPIHAIGTFSLDLLDGGAHFHLYFLLLTFQLYLIFPALFAAIRRHPGAARGVVAASLTFQLAFTASIHYGWRPPVLDIWFTHPGSWLPSYQLYIIGGLYAGANFEAVTTWVRAHIRLVVAAFVATVALAEASYVVDLSRGLNPIHASAVFQPANVLVAVTATLAEYALGLWVMEWASTRRKAFLERASDVSFGLFLAHPLLVAAILDLAAYSGLAALVGTLPTGLVEAFVAFGLVPFVYAVTFVAIDRIRRTHLSLWLTGRRGPRPMPTPAPAPA